MALISTPVLDYTDRDFASLRLRLQGLARSVYPEWTDFNVANIGNLLLELMAFVGDNTGFYQDAQARELFWPTLVRRISAIRLGRLINFTMHGNTPATGVARFTIPTPHTRAVRISLGTRVQSIDPLNPLDFRTTNTDDISIPVGSVYVDVPIEQTEVVSTEIFESSGAPNQEFILARIPYLDGSAVVTADGTYTEIDNFANISPTDQKKFVLVVDQNDRARVRFGDGLLGKIPPSTINISYKVTQGALGNLEVGKIGTVLDTVYDDLGSPVTSIGVTNTVATSGGDDRMTIGQAKNLAPASLRSLTRSVTKPDFETHALEVSGVARAIMLTKNEFSAIQENHGLLLIVARGTKLVSGRYAPAAPTQALLDAVRAKVMTEKPATITFNVDMQDVQANFFTNIDVATRVYLKPGAKAATVRTDIENALKDFFAATLEDGTPNPSIDFGANLLKADGTPVSEIAWSDVMNPIRDVTGVRKVDEGLSGLLLNNLRQSVTIGLDRFPLLRYISIINADTGSTL